MVSEGFTESSQILGRNCLPSVIEFQTEDHKSPLWEIPFVE